MDERGIKEVKTKGFRKAWWQANRSRACKGSGVGKVLDAMQKLGVGENGQPGKVAPENAAQVMSLYDNLLSCLLTAKSKCGSGQKETLAALEEYKKVVNKNYTVVQKMARQHSGLSEDASKELKAQIAKVLELKKLGATLWKQCAKAMDTLMKIGNEYGKEPGQATAKFRKAAEITAKNYDIAAVTKYAKDQILTPAVALEKKIKEAPPTPENTKLKDKGLAETKAVLELGKKLETAGKKLVEEYKNLMKNLPMEGH